MSVFENIAQIKRAARGALASSLDIATVKQRIRALPGPMLGESPEGAPAFRGMRFDIPGDILVRFNDDGSRDAIFIVAQGHDDPSPETVNIHWTPEESTDPPRA